MAALTDLRSLKWPTFWVAINALLQLSCQSKAGEFYSRVYTCDSHEPNGACGTDRDGTRMVCAVGSQLGGRDVCTPVCDAESAAEDDSTVCLASGLRHRRCRPTEGRVNTEHACPRGLECYRTDLLSDEGICIAAPTCSENSDCPDPIRSTCLGALLRDYYPNRSFHSDGLQCLQAHCKTTQASCPPGEACLAHILPTTSLVPDICVPNCDSNLNCPPNFVCSRRVSGAAAPSICLPGIIGSKCSHAQDCLLGVCATTGVGFSICTVPCRTETDCLPLNEPHASFVCNRAEGVLLGYCVTPAAFSGQPCNTSNDCRDGELCFGFNPYRQVSYGECRLPCDSQGKCPARGGVPHVCLEAQGGGCYPGRFGLPCSSSDECVAGFSCANVANAMKICTIPCVSDQDCDANPWTDQDGYCQEGFCHLGGGLGALCERDVECRTRNCRRASPDAPLRCADEIPR